MEREIVLWIFGAIITVMGLVIGHVLMRIGKQDDRIANAEKGIGELRAHVAENYVRGHEIAEVKAIAEQIRIEMTTSIQGLRTEVQHQVTELTKAVYQLIGQKN